MIERHVTIITILLALLFAIPASAGDRDAYGDILRRGTLRVGVSKDYPPLNFNAGERGVEIEMARRLASFLGARLEIVPLNVDEYAKAIEDKRVDMVIAGFSRNLSRARKIWFSEPYLAVTPGVLASDRSLPRTRMGDTFEEPPFRTLWDLVRVPGFKIAVKSGTVYEQLLESEFPNMPRVPVGTNEEGLDLLKKGEVNGFIHDSLYLEYVYLHEPGIRGTHVFLQGGGRTERICVGLPFGDPVLKTQVDTFILEILRIGMLDKLLKEYGGAR
ncbi:MAG: amino acid ABC transporter substrate-binding protein [Spirochaetes bacterium]|nr:amino acid ABC transporter substrate-binding protein [Spirochaetota bacterium]